MATMPGTCDSSVRRQKRALLYTVALALSFAVLAVTSALAWDRLNEVIDNVQRRIYVRQLDLLKSNQHKLVISLDQIAKLHSRIMRNQHGAICNTGIRFPADPDRERGNVAATKKPGTDITTSRQMPGAAGRSIHFSSILPETGPDAGCACRRHLLQKLSISIAASVHNLWDDPGIGNYTYTPDNKFLAQAGKHIPSDFGPMSDAAPEAISAWIANITRHLAAGLQHWTQAKQNPASPFLTGLHSTAAAAPHRQVFSIAAPVYNTPDVMLAVTAIDIDRNAFDKILLHGERPPGFFVFDTSGRVPVLMNNHNDDEQPMLLAISRNWDFLAAGARDLSVTEIGSRFFFVETVAGTPWVAIYCFSLGDILMVSESLWMWISLSMFGALLLLWGGIYLINRYVLLPLNHASQRLVASEQLNRTIIATAPVGLCMLDLQTMQPLLANDLASSYARRWGRQPDLAHSILAAYREIAQQYAADAKGLSSATDSAPAARTDTVLYTELPPTPEIGAPPLLAAFSQLWHQGREVLLCGLSDISIHKEAEAMLQQARLSADQANEAKSMFLATISHEIRTPLHGAMGNLELLANTRLTAAQRSTIGTINRAFDSLLQIINNVLDLSKAGAGQLHLNSESFNFSDLLEDVARTFAPCIVKKGVRFLFLADSNLPPCLHGDEARLRQIFNNLLSNAVKFTNSGMIVMRADLLAIAPGSCTFSVRITDTGIGISEHDRKKLFVPFQQANASIAGQFGGTGLGLSLVKNLCDAMNGTIAIDSLQDHGTEIAITLTLPVAIIHASESNAAGPLLKDVSIALHSTDPAWDLQLRALLSGHGARVHALYADKGGENDAEIVLIACQESDRAAQLLRLAASPARKHGLSKVPARSVLLTPLGPLRPERRGGNVLISTLSRKGLLLALNPAFAIPDESRHAAMDGGHDELAGYHHRFEINLPPQMMQQATASTASQQRRTPIPPFRILLVEDDLVNVTLAQQQLTLLGYVDIERAANGQEALEKCRHNTYQLILTDQFMPKMDGNHLAATLRRRAYPATIIMITASRPSPAHRKNIDGLLLKPVSLEQLRIALSNHCLQAMQPQASLPAISTPETSPAQPHGNILWDAFLQDYAVTMQVLEMAVRQGDNVGCAQQLHKLKGALTILREPLAAEAAALEHALLATQCTALTDDFHHLKLALQAMVDTKAAMRARR